MGEKWLSRLVRVLSTVDRSRIIGCTHPMGSVRIYFDWEFWILHRGIISFHRLEVHGNWRRTVICRKIKLVEF